MKEEYQITQNTYNSVASGYADNAFAKQWMRGYVEDFVSKLSEGSEVLDLGCGPGNDAILFTEKNMQVLGVDFSSEMIKEAQARVPNAHFLCKDFLSLDFESESFNAVWSVGSLHHIDKEDLKLLLSNLYKWLKPEAKGFISVKSGKGSGLETQVQVGVGMKVDKYWVYWTKDEFSELLKNLGLKVTKINETEPERKKDLPEGFEEFWLNVWFEK